MSQLFKKRKKSHKKGSDGAEGSGIGVRYKDRNKEGNGGEGEDLAVGEGDCGGKDEGGVDRSGGANVAVIYEDVEKTDRPSISFASIGVPQNLVRKMAGLGMRSPSWIQRASLPLVMGGSSVLGVAPTGTGKTLAFAIPIFMELSKDPYGIFCVVMTATRELAKQIHEQVCAVGSAIGVRSVEVTGGGDMVKQSLDVSQKPHFVVGTAGRMKEILIGGRVDLSNCRFLVIDEADRVLSPRLNNGLVKDALAVAKSCRAGGACQVLAFTATAGREIVQGMERAMGDRGKLVVVGLDQEEEEEEKCKREGKGEGDKDGGKKEKKKKKGLESKQGGSRNGGTVNGDEGSSSSSAPSKKSILPAGLKQQYIFMPHKMRDVYLVATIRNAMKGEGRRAEDCDFGGSGWTLKGKHRSLDGADSEDDEDMGARSAVIFVGSCERAAYLEVTFRELGLDCCSLHSLLTQDRRNAALGKFKSHQVRILVATDVASRGLDIPEVDLVVNSELPKKATDYVHRVGRTARAGRRGLAVTLVGEEDVRNVHACERYCGRKLEECQLVSDKDVLSIMKKVSKASRVAKMRIEEVGFRDIIEKRERRKRKEKRARESILRRVSVQKTTERS